MDNESPGVLDKPTSRPGPPWEQPGPFLNRYVDTAKGVLLDPNTLFGSMRRQGGLGPPLTYGMLGMVVGIVASFVIDAVMPIRPFALPGMNQTEAVGGLVGGLIIAPVLAICALFIGSGIVHVVLSLLGGANHGYETTFRVFAYTHGSTTPLGIIPFCGGIIGSVWGIVASIIGLAKAHETSTGKAAGAVLIPVVVCCGLFVLLAAAILGMAAAWLGTRPEV